MARTRGSNGRHTTGPIRIPAPKPIPEESPVTQQPTVRPDDPVFLAVTGDLWEMQQRSEGRAEDAKSAALKSQQEMDTQTARCDQLREQAEDLRRQAARADQEASRAYEAAKVAEARRDEAYQVMRGHQNIAAKHGAELAAEMARAGSEASHPAQRQVEQTAPGPRQPEQPVVSAASILDAPSSVNLGPSATQPIVATPQPHGPQGESTRNVS